PFRCADRGAELRNTLREGPHRADIESHCANNIAALQLGEEIAVHQFAKSVQFFSSKSGYGFFEARIFADRIPNWIAAQNLGGQLPVSGSVHHFCIASNA